MLPQLTAEEVGYLKKPERLVIPSVYTDSNLTADETVGFLELLLWWLCPGTPALLLQQHLRGAGCNGPRTRGTPFPWLA